jgi:hypothetical protein
MSMSCACATLDDVAIILRRGSQAGAVVHAIVIEKDTKYLVTLFKGRPGEVVGGIRRLVLIRPFIDLNG